jgi:anti-repressor protein
MNLINIEQTTIGGNLIETVNVRELHEFLGVKTRFNDWFSNRIKEYGFVEGADYKTLTKNLVSGGKRNDHYISIDMAKELSMVERNDKGKQARQYFIECERAVKSKLNSSLPAIQDPQLAAMVMMLTQLDSVKQEQEAQRNELAEIKAKIQATPDQFYTVAGYASLRGMSIDTKKAALLGRKAAKLSREYDMSIGKAHSSIHGTVNTYHVDILCEVFE